MINRYGFYCLIKIKSYFYICTTPVVTMYLFIDIIKVDAILHNITNNSVHFLSGGALHIGGCFQ